MAQKEPTEWTIRMARPIPPPDLELGSPTRRAVVRNDGYVFIHSALEYERDDALVFKTGNLRSMIASLQSILALAEKHFGEDWGK